MFPVYVSLCVSASPQAEWSYLLSGGMASQELANPASDWLSERAWQDVLSLSALPSFSGLVHSFPTHTQDLKTMFDSSQPHRYLFTNTVVKVCGTVLLLVSILSRLCVRVCYSVQGCFSFVIFYESILWYFCFGVPFPNTYSNLLNAINRYPT